VAMPRPRVTVRGGKPHGYAPAHAAQAIREIRQTAIEELGDAEPFSGALSVEVMAYLRSTKLVPTRDRGIVLPIIRPDFDKFAKTVLDGCSSLWQGDAQVVEVVGHKACAWGGVPRWQSAVEAMG
jgi:Holliday junction resolvase RusA-like endonuclease